MRRIFAAVAVVIAIAIAGVAVVQVPQAIVNGIYNAVGPVVVTTPTVNSYGNSCSQQVAAACNEIVQSVEGMVVFDTAKVVVTFVAARVGSR